MSHLNTCLLARSGCIVSDIRIRDWRIPWCPANWWNCDFVTAIAVIFVKSSSEFKDANLAIPTHQMPWRRPEHVHKIHWYFKTSICISVYIGNIWTLGLTLNCGFWLVFSVFLSKIHIFQGRRSAPVEQRKALQVSGFRSRSTAFFPKEPILCFGSLGHDDSIITFLSWNSLIPCLSNGQDLTWSRWLPQPNMQCEAYDWWSTKYLQIPAVLAVLAVLYWYVLICYRLSYGFSSTLFLQVDITRPDWKLERSSDAKAHYWKFCLGTFNTIRRPHQRTTSRILKKQQTSGCDLANIFPNLLVTSNLSITNHNILTSHFWWNAWSPQQWCVKEKQRDSCSHRRHLSICRFQS